MPFDRNILRLLTRYQPGGTVLQRHVGEVNEELDLPVTHFGAGYDDHVVGIVRVQKLVETRGLPRVLRSDDTHIQGNVGGTQKVFGEGNHRVVDDQRIHPRTVERKFRPLGIPRAPASVVLVVDSLLHFGRGREESRHCILGCGQVTGGNCVGDDAPSVLIPSPLEIRCQ